MSSMMRSQRQDVQTQLIAAVTSVCRNALTYASKFSVEGLLGVTLDDSEVLLISLKETVHSSNNGKRPLAVARKRTAKAAGFSDKSNQPQYVVSSSEVVFPSFEMSDASNDGSPSKKKTKNASLSSETPTFPAVEMAFSLAESSSVGASTVAGSAATSMLGWSPGGGAMMTGGSPQYSQLQTQV